MSDADMLVREGRWTEAIEAYDAALDLSPANLEALTYRGWLKVRLGESDSGLADLEAALELEPSFADAQVFAAIVAKDQGDFDRAVAHLVALDGLDSVGPQISQLVSSSDLRAEILAGLLIQNLATDEAGDLDAILEGSQADVDDIARAGVLVDSSDPVLAVRVFTAVLEADPHNLLALVAKGRRLGTNPAIFEESATVASEGLELLDLAVTLEPESTEIRLYRALARQIQGMHQLAAEDLSVIDEAGISDPGLAALREAVAERIHGV